ncbi:dienelactone hydrolase family protein [Thermomonas sp.]|uniref:dienelactone hydrolase family protein n=1 Tax=Thermomonas sp. TaxID=1971895 RepID=UPI001DF77424|nr:dienelactone hydrolase family protein [Thermomonas sp.]MBZ0087994.1 dienelactone hydrolase family protein [Thermomonas sp.]HRO63008.1 dienelactone hydrolase family protein [Thermomonas sp.]
MGDWHTLFTPCGAVQAWLAKPEGEARGAVVVAHEIYGLLPHYQHLCERLAQAGFIALAPAYFDLIEPGLVLGTDRVGSNRGRATVDRLGLDCAVDVTETAADFLADLGHKVGVVGFSWGGTVALLANTRLGLPAVSYYATRNLPFLNEPAGAPLMFHFGALDVAIPPEAIEQHRQKQPQAQVFVYPGADHAFNRDPDPPWQPEAAALAWQRSLEFFTEHLS